MPVDLHKNENSKAGDPVQAVLCMYDVCGIQEFIFRTNKVKEIIGASKLIEDLLDKGIKEVIGKLYEPSKDKLLTDCDWKASAQAGQAGKPLKFDSNSNLEMEVVFIGGGNAYALFRTKELAHHFNSHFSKWLLEKTDSLQLAITWVTKTEDYANDYQALQNEMSKVKARMIPALPMRAFSIIKTEKETGLPLSQDSVYDIDRDECKVVSREVHLKRSAERSLDNANDGRQNLDNLVRQKGEDSSLAFVHIDGNSMGKSIQTAMGKLREYKDAIPEIRKLSQRITQTYKNAFDEMCCALKNYIEELSCEEKHNMQISDDNAPFIRPLILAGDDITFVCRADFAIALTEYFMYKISDQEMIEGDSAYRFSACAGIAFAHSHFPFSDAYRVAEACCSNAKKRAKEPDKSEINNDDARQISPDIGCWLDYQFCSHVNSADLENFRRKNYSMPDGTIYLKRPYRFTFNNILPSSNHTKKAKDECDFALFKERYRRMNDPLSYPSSRSNELRNAYPLGQAYVDKIIAQNKARGWELEENHSQNIDNKCYFDVSEMLGQFQDVFTELVELTKKDQKSNGGASR